MVFRDHLRFVYFVDQVRVALERTFIELLVVPSEDFHVLPRHGGCELAVLDLLHCLLLSHYVREFLLQLGGEEQLIGVDQAHYLLG